MDIRDRFSTTIRQLGDSGNLRRLPHDESGAIDFSSNDYMGLAARRDLQDQFFARVTNRELPMSSSASRLLCGCPAEYLALENYLEQLYGRKALLFNSGYHANVGIISAIADSKTLIVADKLVHASIIDGIMLSKADWHRFRHNDYHHLVQILEREASHYDQIIIIVESIYSMDGDAADIDRLVDIKRRFGVLLYVDEAHAFGVVGPAGLGLSKASAGFSDVDFIVGTFGKAAASQGAFVITDQILKDYLINRSRSLIFSTAISPISCAWTRFMISNLIEMDTERQHLQLIASQLASAIGNSTPSHIQPWIVGDPVKVVDISRQLFEKGIKVLPIRVPTVPPGTERLRISLSANRSQTDIELLINSLLATK